VTNSPLFFKKIRLSLPIAVALSVGAWLTIAPANKAIAQAVPAGELPPGEGNPASQPLPGQTLGSNLSLNQGVNAINAENQSFDRFGLGLSASGGEETNFLGTQTNQQTASYAQFMADGGVVLHSERTRYFLLYQPQYNVYPQFSEVNNFSQTMFQSLARDLTERSSIEWDTTAARYLSLNQFLPQSLGIGGIGVVVPTLGTLLLQDSFELTNAATTLTYRYLLNDRMTLTATATGAFFLMIPSDVANANTIITERFITSGADVRLDYQLTPRDVVGGAITPVYLYGLRPSGHEAAETAQVTYARNLTPTFTAKVGAGPLFIQSSSPQLDSFQDTSYAVNALLSRQLRQSQFSVGYTRAILVNLLAPAIVANSIFSSAYLGFGNNWIFTGSGSYTHNGGSGTAYGPGYVFGGSAQIAYQVGKSVQLFALYSGFSENFTTGAPPQSLGFTRNQFGGGIRFNLGNPIASGNSTNSGGIQ
jgi:hypothetical protein